MSQEDNWDCRVLVGEAIRRQREKGLERGDVSAGVYSTTKGGRR